MIKFIFLGFVQGITEFLPVSSSGHLVIFQQLLKINQEVVFLDTVLHLGTLFSLLIFFRKDIIILLSNFITALFDIALRGNFSGVWRNDDKFRLCIYIGVTTFITGVIGLFGKDFFERQFESITTVILGLFILSAILFFTKKFINGQRQLKHISIKDSFAIGLVQAVAIIPGISRSGVTISTALFRNITNEDAFKFSFFVSMPAILGAFILKLKDVQNIERTIPILYLLGGFLAAFASGLLALYFLRLILKKDNFYKFSYYCFLLAIVVWILKIRNFF